MNSKYKCVLFDLDHTLWDYELNSRDTLFELFEQYKLSSRGIGDEAFVNVFRDVNNSLWELYDKGLIDSEVIRKERFARILAAFDVTDEKLCAELSHDYLWGCPRKCNLIPDALDTLDYLSEKYTLAVVTNGFEEIQHMKLASGKMTHYFDHIITSQKAGYKKPAKEIFEYALDANGVKCHEAIMIGDNPVTDIGGARNACIDAVFFNPGALTRDVDVHYEIKALSELRQFL
ncbi:MAG TPA: YjjG family noncanonical pyrimidine nucleotidase [Ohtaekwangia sp.]|nr:YjjG family noncanonical pyrimidine nucleotidase [Ohtaekwangia sp.]